MPAAIAPSLPDLGHLAGQLGIPVLSQHTDPDPAGARTGRVVAEALRAAGASGSLVNHSERRIPEAEVGEVVGRLREVGLASIVCAGDLEETGRLARFRPPFLAIEPPELIGGDVSVTSARPELLREAVRAVRSVSAETVVLCGAGIHDAADIRAALALGTEGVLVASAVARSADPGVAIERLVSGFGPPTERTKGV